MLASDQQWQLFGFDVRHLGRLWRSAWADFLWGDQSPVRARLDEIVQLQAPAGVASYHAGRPVPQADSECLAFMLPDELVLLKTLQLPLAAEPELEAVMALEAAANSPFPATDTSYGWTRLDKTHDSIGVELAIVSRSSAMRFLGANYDRHDARVQEVWAQGGERPIVLRGFGEHERLQRYQQRLRRIGFMLVGAAVLLLAMTGVAAGMKYLELQQYQQRSAEVVTEAAEAMKMRSDLAAANETIAAVNQIVRLYPNPHYELARLTQLLGDEAYIAQLSMRGDEMDLRARAIDAASVYAQLTAEPAFDEVTSPQATTRLGDGVEQFYVNIRLRTEASQ